MKHPFLIMHHEDESFERDLLQRFLSIGTESISGSLTHGNTSKKGQTNLGHWREI